MPGRQYGAPKDPRSETKPAAGYGSNPTQNAPTTKKEDPSPEARIVTEFHKNAAVDSRDEDIHHTLGSNPNQAAKGNHKHDGSDSVLLLEGVVLTGSKGGNAALLSVIAALVKLGAKDTTT